VKRLLRASVLAALTLATCAAGANAQRPPSITAPSAILVEPSSGTIVYARAPYKRRAIASTTKMMTALLLLERRSLSHRIRAVNYSGSAGESTAGIEAGERLTAADMLRALLLPSANEAAASIAVDVGGSQRGFVRMMNARAKRAGLRGTHFANPVGLDASGNYSTARDLAQLGILLRRNKFARETMNRSKATLYSGAHRRVVFNHKLGIVELHLCHDSCSKNTTGFSVATRDLQTPG
jgi:D-alanyl-D-alanine carboxypeptidase (penicillin-binding protein 5/6)